MAPGFAGFTLGERLPGDEFGEAFTAVNSAGRRARVLRVKPELAVRGGFAEAFLAAGDRLAQLEDRHVVATAAVGRDDAGRLLAVSDLVAGAVTLADVLAAAADGGASCPRGVAVHVARAVASALSRAHRVGLIHGGVHPKSVLVDPEGRVRLADFAIAPALARAAEEDPGLLRGLLGTVAPELALGEPLDARSDVYATGALLIWMLTGAPPPGVFDAPPVLIDLVQRAMDPDPARRHDDGAALAAALAQAAELMGDERFGDADVAAFARRVGAFAVAHGATGAEDALDAETEGFLAELAGTPSERAVSLSDILSEEPTRAGSSGGAGGSGSHGSIDVDVGDDEATRAGTDLGAAERPGADESALTPMVEFHSDNAPTRVAPDPDRVAMPHEREPTRTDQTPLPAPLPQHDVPTGSFALVPDPYGARRVGDSVVETIVRPDPAEDLRRLPLPAEESGVRPTPRGDATDVVATGVGAESSDAPDETIPARGPGLARSPSAPAARETSAPKTPARPEGSSPGSAAAVASAVEPSVPAITGLSRRAPTPVPAAAQAPFPAFPRPGTGTGRLAQPVNYEDPALHAPVSLKKSHATLWATMVILLMGAAGLAVWQLEKTRDEVSARDADDQKKREAAAAEAKKAARVGDVVVTSEPKEAAVWMLLGRTPLDTMPLSNAQVIELRVEQEGMRPVDLPVIPSMWTGAGDTMKAAVHAKLEPLAAGQVAPAAPPAPPDVPAPPPASRGHGVIHLDSEPAGAQVYLLVGFTDDTRIGNQRVDREHELKVAKDGFAPAVLVVHPADWTDPGGAPRGEVAVSAKLVPLPPAPGSPPPGGSALKAPSRH